MSLMKVIEVTAFGGTEMLQLAERKRPQWQAGEVLVQVYASGVNRMDLVQREGHYPPPAGISDLLGVEVAGIIVDGDAAALQASGFALGDRVCAILAGGGYAEYVTVAVSNCLPVPKGLTMAEAASLPETFFTVWSNLFDYGNLQAGQTLLVQGGSSGIGVTAIQMAKAVGAEVIVTAGSQAKCDACLQLGADYAINYKTTDFVEEIKTITNKQGVNLVLDMVGGDYIEREIKSMALEGKLLVIAFLGGRAARFDVARLLLKRLTIAGTTLRSRSTVYKAKITQALRRDFWPLLESKAIKPMVQAVYPAAQAVEGRANGAVVAHEVLQRGQHIGKIVLSWREE